MRVYDQTRCPLTKVYLGYRCWGTGDGESAVDRVFRDETAALIWCGDQNLPDDCWREYEEREVE